MLGRRNFACYLESSMSWRREIRYGKCAEVLSDDQTGVNVDGTREKLYCGMGRVVPKVSRNVRVAGTWRVSKTTEPGNREPG